MTANCPECGAPLNQEASCQSIFDTFLALEFTDPGYGEVHFLTVASFMIQHGRYSDEALGWIEENLRSYLEQGVSAAQIRSRATQNADQTRRSWKVVRQPGEPPLPKIPWSMTIVDVANNYKDANSYRDLVIRWASIILQEMKPLTHRHG